MASPVSSHRRELPSLKRIFTRVLIVVVLALAVGGVAAYYWVHSAQQAARPYFDGRIQLAGLSAPVTVIRDQQGVPHIQAATMEDLFLAQGYVTAQDRLWQMDITRRYAAGELSEALGARMLPTDKAQRLLGFNRLAQQQYAMMTPRDRGYFDAYSRGVNAYIAEHRDALPLEFRILRYAPRAWTAEDSLLIGASLGELLTHGQYLTELKREAVSARLGPQLAADLYVNTSPNDVPPALQADPDGADFTDTTPAAPEQSGLPAADREFIARFVRSNDFMADEDSPYAAGSNNWVVSGAHTVSGKPLLSNDMHLPIQIPNTWYEAHLTSGDFDVAGVSLPGMPAVIVGHNRRIAWGFTNVMADVEDVYIETFNAQGQYQTPAGWKQPEIRHESILIKGGATEPMDVVITRHGPIMTDAVKGEQRKVALASTMLRPEALYFPFFEVNRAANWNEFRAAVSKLAVPENAVYADVDGHIGYQATGLFPKRDHWDGALPVSGSDDAHEWIGTLDTSVLPSVADPASGILATANSRITPDGYPDTLSNEWVAPLRTKRILQLLHEDKRFTREDMLAIQTDVYSRFDRYVADRFVYAIDHSSKADARTRAAADLMRRWDGRMEMDSAAAAIERTSRIRLRRMLLQSKLGDDFRMYSWFMDPVWLENVLNLQPQRWLPAGQANWNDALTAAVDLALKENKAPSDLATWKYGELFPVQIEHLVFANIPLLNKSAGPGRLPQSGDGDTVKQVGLQFGPSERFTADLGDLSQSTLNIPVGQSGNLGEPHYMDQWNAWYRGTTFTLAFDPQQVRKAREHELTLVP